ncbi:MAG: hypothetical protein II874_04090 [Bacteroidales bacterium]|nr:hypothetical protein [Bacteroidales bacterium]MBR6246148.1 hypothetical protein [Bacteroidales bacterium]
MFKQILAALQQKFPGVEASWLEPMARKLAKETTKAEDVQAAVDAVTTSQVMETYSDFRVNQAVATASTKAVTDYETKHNLKDGKPVEAGGTSGNQTQPAQQQPNNQEEPAWAKKLAERLDAIEERETAKANAAKQQGFGSTLVAILKEKGVRESFYAPIINGREFKDEDEVKAFAETVEQSFKDDEQAVANANHSGNRQPDQSGAGQQGDEDPLLKAAQEKTDQLAAEKNKKS